MTIADALKKVRQIQIRSGAPEVFETAARDLACRSGAVVLKVAKHDLRRRAGVVQLLDADTPARQGGAVPPGRVVIRLREDGSGVIATSDTRFLYAAVAYLLDVLADRDLRQVASGLTLTPAFAWNRSCYDLFLTQEGRIQHGLDPRDATCAAWPSAGFTHVEVNGLAYPMGLETGPKGEVYPMFYTYCPALDQFVYSSLNKGLYPFYYLSANLAFLKRNAALARKYGLVPGPAVLRAAVGARGVLRALPDAARRRASIIRSGRSSRATR